MLEVKRGSSASDDELHHAVMDAAGVVVNVVLWDGQTKFDPGPDLRLVKAPREVGPGWKLDGENWTAPEPRKRSRS